MAGSTCQDVDGMQTTNEVHLKVPANLEPKLERQIKEYVQMRELGEQMSGAGLLDPTRLA